MQILLIVHVLIIGLFSFLGWAIRYKKHDWYEQLMKQMD